MTKEEAKKLEEDYKKFAVYEKRLRKLQADKKAGVDAFTLYADFEAIKKDYDKDFGLPAGAKGAVYTSSGAEEQAMAIANDAQKVKAPKIKKSLDEWSTSQKNTSTTTATEQPKEKNLVKKINGKINISSDGGKTWVEKSDISKENLEKIDKFSKPKTEVAKPGVEGTVKQKTNVKQSDISIDSEEETKRQERAGTTPEGYVTQEEYDKLDELYKKAKDSSGGNPNKKTPETLAFQKYYHSIPALKKVAEQIIANEKAVTTKGKTLPAGQRYDITANEDSMFGPRTEKYWQAVKKEEGKPAEDKDITLADEEDQEAERDAIKRNPPMAKRTGQYAPWYLQDIIKNAGAAADLGRIKRYLPWQATPQVFLPEATFYDPTRELAANTEQANLAMQAQQAFTNPQQLAAASSVIQGQALKNAADVMGRYNNLNVGLANQLNQQRTEIMNTASQNKANLDTQLWDKYTVANQQFDNAKAMARQNLRQSYMDAITNRAKAQALNTIYPNYYTDPSRGGMVDFNPDYGPFVPTTSSNDDVASKVKKLMTDIPGLTPDKALDYYRSNKNASTEEDDNQGESYLRAAGIMS